MAISVPRGYRLAGVHCGIKRNPAKHDLALIVSERPAVAAGVYTQNQVVAAPVLLNRARTPSETIRAVAVNSGNANACTGDRGLDDAKAMARHAAEAAGIRAEEVLVLSTGIIGEFLPLKKIAAGLAAAAGKLADDDEALAAAARGMMTTDTVHKLAGRTLELAGRTVQLTGLAKGAAMIGPRMATMLAVVLTDAPLKSSDAQAWLAAAVDESFNCISVDGHMSTNDSVLLLANGVTGGEPLTGTDAEAFRAALREVCIELARAIADDGEGATHLITIDVTGCASRADAHAIAKTVAESPLVKTAIAGGDPNWGRIVSAAGYAPVKIDPGRLTLELNGFLLFAGGAPQPADEAAVSQSIRENRETHVVLRLEAGDAAVRFWASDLTAEYVRLNADYHT